MSFNVIGAFTPIHSCPLLSLSVNELAALLRLRLTPIHLRSLAVRCQFRCQSTAQRRQIARSLSGFCGSARPSIRGRGSDRPRTGPTANSKTFGDAACRSNARARGPARESRHGAAGTWYRGARLADTDLGIGIGCRYERQVGRLGGSGCAQPVLPRSTASPLVAATWYCLPCFGAGGENAGKRYNQPWPVTITPK